ncbi:hypothetical protein AVEN_126151-1 [Araneus ventricosus]|uniref:Inosine/uridine-preferring nucleoside hydrolase domain-containing protein n=1 Tax=Araneus ventricosus TaxID=182803 RepID=A0A4Y2P0D5_ARAVE|nr:hypothetical protein AVEN_126151-1 [Araneus ventricosus]
MTKLGIVVNILTLGPETLETDDLSAECSRRGEEGHGGRQGLGNVTETAEFNFHSDPESAHMVLGEALCPVKLVPWETCLEFNLSFVSISFGNKSCKNPFGIDPVFTFTDKLLNEQSVLNSLFLWNIF